MSATALTGTALQDGLATFVAGAAVDADTGRYRFSASASEPTVYSSTYAAMTLDLVGRLGDVPVGVRRAWADQLCDHQDDDGLFRDPVIHDQGMYAGDPLWCGRPHLSHHVVTALMCLGARPRRRLAWLDPFLPTGAISAWLEEREWADRPAWVGNEVMNVGCLLQYARDELGEVRAGRAIGELLRWLRAYELDPATGMWGGLDATDPVDRSHLVQAAYHLWPLFSYDGLPIPAAPAAVRTVLATQNSRGGFGWGVHNPDEPEWSSACEDIDSIEPLARYGTAEPELAPAARAALERALVAVLENRNADGGFVFVRGRRHWYGHDELTAEADQSSLFATWFRALSLAFVSQALPASSVGRVPWRFCCAPGMQFWSPRRHG